MSWNLYNWDRTKDDEEIEIAAETLRDFDLLAVQEVVTSPPGAQAVAKLDAELDRTGFEWDYRLSNPTTGDGTERYAFLWKPSRVRLIGQAWLEPSLADPIDREPYLARFEHRETGQRLLVASLHAVPSSKNAAREVALLDRLHREYEAPASSCSATSTPTRTTMPSTTSGASATGPYSTTSPPVSVERAPLGPTATSPASTTAFSSKPDGYGPRGAGCSTSRIASRR